MKTDRLVILLAGLLLVSSLPIDGRTWTIKLRRQHKVSIVVENADTAVAQELAKQVEGVHDAFVTRKNALTILRSGKGSGYDPVEVNALLDHTREDLSQAIQQAGKSSLGPLDAWAKDKLQEIQSEVPPPAPIASLPEPYAPRATAVFAVSRGFGFPMLATNKPAPKKPKAAPPKPQGIPVSATDRILNQAEEVIRQIFTLADTNDLWVDVWAGSTPSDKAFFSFWAHGAVKGADKSAAVIKTDNWKKHMARGYYDYEIKWPTGAVTLTIKYPDPTADVPSERLDLVQGSEFFCCEFNKSGNCHHVEDQKDCR